jgi:phage-related protein
MQYDVILTDEAQKDFNKLNAVSQKKLDKDYDVIRKVGTDFAYIKHLEGKLFEIRTDDLRSLFTYKKGSVIIIAVIFVKKSQATPEKYKKRAKRILDI